MTVWHQSPVRRRTPLLSLENSLDDDYNLNRNHVSPIHADDIISLQPGQTERRTLFSESSPTQSEVQDSHDEIRNNERFFRYLTPNKHDDSGIADGLVDVFGEDARLGKTLSKTGLVLDEAQIDSLNNTLHSADPDRVSAYKENT